ncbi:MAG: EamA family transporter [Candidatus Moranbacteria bacterium]|nr:EamA family transporter [Candidatus Moranbacteria bacterium]MBP9801184.1 EamA family transporter [Candidatus Moranbacteria bacterium]
MEHSWLLIALVAPFLWALTAVLDSYFVVNWYRDKYDAIVVSGVFQSLPLLLVLLGIVQFSLPSSEVFFFAASAGLVFIGSFYCYFTALFNDNDSSLAQTFWNFTVPVVPFLAWLLFGEVLEFRHYIGVLLSFFGVLALAFYQKIIRGVKMRNFSLPMIGATILFSLSMIFSKEAYAGGNFFDVLLIFCVSSSIGSLMILALKYRSGFFVRFREIVSLTKKNFVWFIISEGLYFIGTVTSQRALSLAPSATFIVVIEALVPIFIILISVALIWLYRVTSRQNRVVKQVLLKQVSGASVKVFATVCLVVAVAFVA